MSIAISIVSHQHGASVQLLMQQLASLADPALHRVIITLNVPEPVLLSFLQQGDWPFELHVLENPKPRGFAANHNHAFAEDLNLQGSAYFAVLNPDVRLLDNPWPALLAALQQNPQAGASYPLQLNEQGQRQDSERLAPTPARLLRRYLGGRRHELVGQQAADWVNAACLLLRASVFASLGGFNENYHMYCEDVDLCLRLQLTGHSLLRVESARLVHQAQRASHRQARHFFWHVRSLLQLWRSPIWRQWRQWQQQQEAENPL